MKEILLEIGDGPKFKATTQWMADRYNKANKELFNGALGECFFNVAPLPSNKLGEFEMRATKYGYKVYANRRTRQLFIEDRSLGTREYVNKDNFVELCHPTITISSYYSGTEEALYNTLVHEMCHYYTYMRGRAPKQGHGIEFRDIALLVSYRSNGEITIKRLAEAEDMKNYELDDEIQQKIDKRKTAKKANAHYYLIFYKDGKVGLINPTDECLKTIINYEQRKNSKVSEILEITDADITNELYDKGFSNKCRTYKIWTTAAGITQDNEIVKNILNNPNTYNTILRNE